MLFLAIKYLWMFNMSDLSPKLPLIPKVGPFFNIKMLFVLYLEWDDELLSTPNLIRFIVVSLSKLQKVALLNISPYPPYTNFSLSIFFTILVAPNKQFLNLKLLPGCFG